MKPLTPEEQKLANKMIAQLIKEEIELEKQGKNRKDLYKNESDAEGLDDLVEDTADEVLIWCANKPYSRWILASIFGLWGFVFFMLGDAYGILSDLWLRQYIGQ